MRPKIGILRKLSAQSCRVSHNTEWGYLSPDIYSLKVMATQDVFPCQHTIDQLRTLQLIWERERFNLKSLNFNTVILTMLYFKILIKIILQLSPDLTVDVFTTASSLQLSKAFQQLLIFKIIIALYKMQEMQRDAIYSLLILQHYVFQLALHFMSKWTHITIDLMNHKKFWSLFSKIIGIRKSDNFYQILKTAEIIYEETGMPCRLPSSQRSIHIQ